MKALESKKTAGRGEVGREFEILFGAYLGLENNVEAYAEESLDEKMREAIENLARGRMNPDEAHEFLAGLRGQPAAVGHLAKRLRETKEPAGEEE